MYLEPLYSILYASPSVVNFKSQLASIFWFVISPVLPILKSLVTSKLDSVTKRHCPKSLSNLNPNVLFANTWSTICVFTSDSIVVAIAGFISTSWAPVGITSLTKTGPELSAFNSVPLPLTVTILTHLYVTAPK